MIDIHYDGKYPNLCSGKLVITIDNVRWVFPDGCLQTGGCVSFSKDRDENITTGPWSITQWAEGFPEEKKQDVLDEINCCIPHGCCGGCV